MKSQFDHNVLSSFYLWFEDRLTAVGEAVITGKSQIFKYSKGINTPSNLNSFYSSEKQFCANHSGNINYIFIDNQQTNQNSSGIVGVSGKVLFDYNNGRILLESSYYGTGSYISGNFVQKEINLYITNDTEEEIVLKNEFYINSGQSYSDSINQLAKAEYRMPCIFLSNGYSENNGFAMGGLRDTKTVIKAIVFAKSNYQLDGILSLFRDSSEKCFKIIDQKDFPYGEYWHIKNYPYSYTGLINTKKIDEAFIKDVRVYKLKDTAQGALSKIRKDLYLGYIDFEISTIRTI